MTPLGILGLMLMIHIHSQCGYIDDVYIQCYIIIAGPLKRNIGRLLENGVGAKK